MINSEFNKMDINESVLELARSAIASVGRLARSEIRKSAKKVIKLAEGGDYSAFVNEYARLHGLALMAELSEEDVIPHTGLEYMTALSIALSGRSGVDGVDYVELLRSKGSLEIERALVELDKCDDISEALYMMSSGSDLLFGTLLIDMIASALRKDEKH